MIILIPLGGIGERFKQLGYVQPKALIPIFGKPILYYLLDYIIQSKSINKIKAVCIPYNKEYQHYAFEDQLKKDYPTLRFIFTTLTKNTRGAAETISIALNKLSLFAQEIENCPVLCLDGDNFYKDIDIIDLWAGNNSIITFNSTETDPIYSYVKITKDNDITEIMEKNKISDNACCGAYGFASWQTLLQYALEIIKQDSLGEFYTSAIISCMIKNNTLFKNITIEQKNYICLGTPLQVQYFYYNYPKVSCENNCIIIKPKRYCFDLDNTLITSPMTLGDYSTVSPIKKNIDFLKYLKRFGNTIIIHTARRMKTFNGNVGKVIADVGQQTLETLRIFDIPYDEIYFGKPYADAYIDDLAVNFQNMDMEKYLGWYSAPENIAPRSFNKITQSTIATITKSSSANLSGEIHWYLNAPPELKDIFPLFIDYSLDQGNMYYIMEKIAGVSVSSLYLSELLTTTILQNIMNTIIRIQDINIPTIINIPSIINNPATELNIYANYADKLSKRYSSESNRIFYDNFPQANKCYNNIITKLRNYELNNLGACVCSHGDPVFTNIMINNYGKIKMFDMRGKLGDIDTIYGDWLYDWAKLYQSLLGYDAVLQNKYISEPYQHKMLAFFKDYFINKFSEEDFINLELISYSLIFSLLPLHIEAPEKCKQFYSLIPDNCKE